MARRALTALATITSLLLLAPPASAQQPSTPQDCDDVEGFHRLDFWIGDWNVVDSEGAVQGTNRIEKVLDGCAIVERWTGAEGGRGLSLFYFNALNRTWKQVWVTSRATVAGALKEKQLVEELPDGGVRFQGVIVLADGRSILDRTTLTPLEGGQVRQVVEWSRDGGVNWTESFQGLYEPREPEAS
jgi:hypothetical protein